MNLGTHKRWMSAIHRAVVRSSVSFAILTSALAFAAEAQTVASAPPAAASSTFANPIALAERAMLCKRIVEDQGSRQAGANTQSVAASWGKMEAMAKWWAVLHGYSLADLARWDDVSPSEYPNLTAETCARDAALLSTQWPQLERDTYARNWQTTLRESRESEAFAFSEGIGLEQVALPRRIGWCRQALESLLDAFSKQPGVDPGSADGAAKIAQAKEHMALSLEFWNGLYTDVYEAGGFPSRDRLSLSMGAATFAGIRNDFLLLGQPPEWVARVDRSFLESNGNVCHRAAEVMLYGE